ncbi:MAG: hypothetical protein QXY70_03765 [Nanopusillaceae archaeon]
MPEEPFFYFLKNSLITIENGNINIFRGLNIIVPARLIIYLRNLLIEKFGKDVSKEILFKLGEYQTRQAIERYKIIFEIEKEYTEKAFNFFEDIISILGLGKSKINIIYKDGILLEMLLYNNPIAIEFRLMGMTSEEPIDDYIRGLIYGGVKSILRTDIEKIEIVETKCIALGDECCKFEVVSKTKP